MRCICEDCIHRKGWFIALPKSGEGGFTGVMCEPPAYTMRYISVPDICISFKPIASEDNCNGDCEHCESHTEWQEWAE